MLYLVPCLSDTDSRLQPDSRLQGITAHLDGLNSDWSAAFASLFRSLQNGHCEYFYVVATEFTAFFRAPDTGMCARPATAWYSPMHAWYSHARAPPQHRD